MIITRKQKRQTKAARKIKKDRWRTRQREERQKTKTKGCTQCLQQGLINMVY